MLGCTIIQGLESGTTRKSGLVAISRQENPQGVLPNKEVGGLGPHIKFGGKIWGKVRSSSPNKRKHLGSSVNTRLKNWEKVQILGSYLKFRGQNLGYFVTYIFRGKIWGSNKNFRGKFWGHAPDLLIWKYPPEGQSCGFIPDRLKT